ncbi:MAG: YgjP-like metallopeptidase domain-containing protein, partial [Fusobacteriaceae bacterium]
MYQIKIQRKNIKNIILKIHSDGEISLSAPKKISQKILDDFIHSKKDWIQKRMKKIKMKKDISTEKNYDFFYFLGDKFPFSHLLNFFNLDSKEKEFSLEKKKSLLKMFLEIKSKELIPPMVDKYLLET